MEREEEWAGGIEMIFQATWQQVLDGTKTQTRRPVKPGEELIKVPGAVWMTDGSHRMCVYYDRQGKGKWAHGRIKWAEGKTYAVQPGRGKKSIGRIRITEIRRERLQEISLEDLEEEGCPSGVILASIYKPGPIDVDSPIFKWYIGLWNSCYRKPYRWEDNPEVWVLEFEKLEKRW